MRSIKNELLHFKVVEVIRETDECKTFLLREINNKLICFIPGQFLTFKIQFGNQQFQRIYSISTSPYELPVVGFTVKKNNKGFISNFLFDGLNVGDCIPAFPPSGHFIVEPEKFTDREFVFIAAGSGITPIRSMIKTLLIALPEVKIILLYGNRNETNIIYRDELEQLSGSYNNFKLFHVLSQPSEVWWGLKGRIDFSLIRNIFSLEKIPCEAEFYINGPGKMTENLSEGLLSLNIKQEKIHKEYFSISILQDDLTNEYGNIPNEVTIIINQQEHKIIVEPGNSILETALSIGLEIPNSCNIGECGTCRAKLISGKVNLVQQTALTENDISEGYCLTCVGFPKSDDVIIDYDAIASW